MRFNLEDLKEKERERAPIPLKEHVSLEREDSCQRALSLLAEGTCPWAKGDWLEDGVCVFSIPGLLQECQYYVKTLHELYFKCTLQAIQGFSRLILTP